MLDTLTIAAVVDELNSRLIDGRIQQIAHVDDLTLACEVYAAQRRQWLILSADHVRARVHISEGQVPVDPEKISPILLLLRKYARGGRIVAVSQPRYERILRVSIAKPLRVNNDTDEPDDDDSDPEFAYSDLIVEMMGRRSNVILVSQDGRIRDAIKRVTPAMSRVRSVLPGKPYAPPPPQEKLDPRQASVNDFLRDAVTTDAKLERWLVERYLAISPALAREIAARAEIEPATAVGGLQAPEVQHVLAAMADLFAPLDTGNWQPMAYSLPSGSVIASPVRLLSVEAVEGMVATPVESMSRAIEIATVEAPSPGGASAGRHTARRERLETEIVEAVERARQTVISLEKQATLAEEADTWRRMGEAIYASLGRIGPRDTQVVADDGLVVPLNPALSASDNARAYFERYRKARSAEHNIPELLDDARGRVAYLEQLLLTAHQAERFDDIEAARFEWLAWQAHQSGGAPAGKRPPRTPSNARKPRSFRSSRGDRVWVGRSGPQNEMVTFEIAGPNDLWLHARNMPGAHVIVRWNGPDDDEVLGRAASLAAWFSAGRGSTATEVDDTVVRHVRKIRGAGPGQVTYRNERTLSVRPRSEADLGFEPD